jgi:hypothetical protein
MLVHAAVLFCPVLSYPVLSYPVLSHPILSYPILSYPILSYPILSYPILSHPVLSHPILSYPILSCLILSHPVLSYPILSYPILSYPILSCPILSYPVLSYPVLSYPILSYPIPEWVCCFSNHLSATLISDTYIRSQSFLLYFLPSLPLPPSLSLSLSLSFPLSLLLHPSRHPSLALRSDALTHFPTASSPCSPALHPQTTGGPFPSLSSPYLQIRGSCTVTSTEDPTCPFDKLYSSSLGAPYPHFSPHYTHRHLKPMVLNA